MCLHPIFIPNPNFGSLNQSFHKNAFLKDTTSRYIPINCGHCKQCIALKQIYLVQRIQMESINNYLFMVMLSYNEQSLSRLELNGYSIPYADLSDITNMFKRIRREDGFERPFKYFCVSELGSKKGRPHFHLLLSLPKWCVDNEFTPINLEKQLYEKVFYYWSHNVGSDKYPVYSPNCTFHSAWRNGKLYRNYDLHYIVPYATDKGVASPAFYCLKYMLKLSEREKRLQQALRLNLSPDMYKHVYSIVKSRYCFSKGLGLIRSSYSYNQRKKITSDMYDSDIVHHIRKGIIFSREKSSFPFYIHPDDGTTFPLAPFYCERFLSLDDKLAFWHYNAPADKKDNFVERQFLTVDQCEQAERNFERLINIVDSSDIETIL